MKKVLFMVFAAIAFVSCTQQEDINVNSEGKTTLSVKLNFSKLTTKSGDKDIFTEGNIPEWSELLLIVKDKNNGIQEQRTYTKEGFDDLDNGVILFEKVPATLSGGKVEVYILTEVIDWGSLEPDNLPLLAKDQPDINKWQKSGEIKAGIYGKFTNIPYYGMGGITPKGLNPSNNHELLEATVSVTPELGRIQVVNSPLVGGTENQVTVNEINLLAIYINRVESNGGVKEIRTNGSNVDPITWESSFYGPGQPLVEMWDDLTPINRSTRSSTGITGYGYQIFDKSTPHIILKISYTLSSNPTPTTGYLTITKFTYEEGGISFSGGDLIVNKGKIYTIDLAKLQPKYTQIGEDPYDDTTYYDLNVEVKVNEWTVINVTPEL